VNILKDVYLKTHKTLKEETNDAGETTYYIESELSIDGAEWEKCTIIWSD
jgi:hypothetical protein